MTSIHEHIAKDVATREGWGDRYTVRVGVAWYDANAGIFRGYNTANNDSNGVDFNGSVGVVTRVSMTAGIAVNTATTDTIDVVSYALKDGAGVKYLYRPNVNTFPSGISTIVENTQTLELKGKIAMGAAEGRLSRTGDSVDFWAELLDNGGQANNGFQFVIEYLQITPTR